MPVTCPDENTLNAFAERLLDERAREDVEQHLDGCIDCLTIVSEMAHALAESPQLSPTMRDTAHSRTGEDAPLQHGSVVGRYTVLEILGEGGMGTVYLAHDPQLDRRVALKVLRGDPTNDPEPGARMAREARIMARVAHPNIVTIFDAGEVAGRTYIAMELIGGGTLARWLRAENRPPREILAMFAVAGRALAAAHSAGVVHRDFKPENVLLDEAGRIAVTDFGIATSSDHALPLRSSKRISLRDSSGTLTQTGTLLGTPGYMSPEQYAGEKIDAQSDQFSFAVALYQALYRQPPFEGDGLEARSEAVLAGRFRPLADSDRHGVTPRMHKALVRALSREPGERFPTLLALLAELEPPPAGSMGKILGVGAIALGVIAIVVAVAKGSSARAAAGRDAGPPALVATTTKAGVRTAVVALGVANQTGDARYDGIVEATLAEAISPSKKLDAYNASDLRAITEKLDPATQGEDEAAARSLETRDHRPVVVVRGAITRADAGLAVSLLAKDVASGKTVADLRDVAATPQALAATIGRMATNLRDAIGDTGDRGDADAIVLSSSIDALHEWAMGQALRTSGDYLGALAHLKLAVAADPDFAEAHAALGLALYDLQDQPAAAKEIRIALKSSDHLGQRRRLGLLADSYAAEGRHAESISASEQLLSIWPGDLVTQIGVTATALDAGEWSLGLELGRRAATDHPDAVVARSNLLLALEARGEFAEVARDGDDVLRSFPHPPRYAFAFVAMANALQGDRDRALAAYDMLEKIDAEFADEGRADLALFEGRLDDAAALLRRQMAPALARSDPGAIRTEFHSLSIVLARKGDRAGAIANARAGLGGGNVEIQYELARLLLENSNDEKTAADFARAWEENAGATWRAYTKVLEGDLLVHRHKYRDAVQSYRAAQRVRDMWRVHERVAQALLADHAFAEAEAEFTICVDRRGEGSVVGTPSLQYLPAVYLGLARARDGQKSPLTAEAYRAAIGAAPPAQHDVGLDDARRRLAALDAKR